MPRPVPWPPWSLGAGGPLCLPDGRQVSPGLRSLLPGPDLAGLTQASPFVVSRQETVCPFFPRGQTPSAFTS